MDSCTGCSASNRIEEQTQSEHSDGLAHQKLPRRLRPFRSQAARSWPCYLLDHCYLSRRSPSAIDGEACPVDERSLIGSQVPHHRGNLVGLAQSADGLAGAELGPGFLFRVFVKLLEIAFHERRLHGSGRSEE